MEAIKNWFMNNWQYLLKVLLVVVLGFILVKIILKIFNAVSKRSKMEKTAHGFIHALLRILLYVIYFIVVLTVLGIPTTSFVAILTAFSLALSLALQDTLSNFASGILLIWNKPFVVGDFVQIGSSSGTIKEVKIATTTLSTPDNKIIILPNSTVAKAEITNYSKEPDRRVDLTFAAAYGCDVEKVKGVIMTVVEKHPLVNQDLGITVRLSEQGDSSLNFVTRVWTKNENYWTVYFDLNEQMVKAFEDAKIEIPFNQLDVHLRNAD